MGYGGALVYSGLARNLKARFPQKKVVFVYPLTLDELVWRRGAQDRLVWQHNTDIDLVTNRLHWFFVRHRYPQAHSFVINLDDPRYFYWIKDHGDWIEYKQGKHAIQIACDVHGLADCDLRSRIVVTPAEERAVETLLQRHSLTAGQYLCVEPHTKGIFTANKAWFFECWQEVVYRLLAYFKSAGMPYRVVQIGAPGSPILAGVINLVDQTTFRETAGIVARSRLLVSAEGGLPHLAAATGTPAVVLHSNVLPPELVAYPHNKNLYADQTCVCRGLKTPCPRGRACMGRITVDDVYNAVLDVLSHTVTDPQ